MTVSAVMSGRWLQCWARLPCSSSPRHSHSNSRTSSPLGAIRANITFGFHMTRVLKEPQCS